MEEVMYLEDLPAFKNASSYARKFAEELLTLLKGHYTGNKGYHLDFLPGLNG